MSVPAVAKAKSIIKYSAKNCMNFMKILVNIIKLAKLTKCNKKKYIKNGVIIIFLLLKFLCGLILAKATKSFRNYPQKKAGKWKMHLAH